MYLSWTAECAAGGDGPGPVRGSAVQPGLRGGGRAARPRDILVAGRYQGRPSTEEHHGKGAADFVPVDPDPILIFMWIQIPLLYSCGCGNRTGNMMRIALGKVGRSCSYRFPPGSRVNDKSQKSDERRDRWYFYS